MGWERVYEAGEGIPNGKKTIYMGRETVYGTGKIIYKAEQIIPGREKTMYNAKEIIYPRAEGIPGRVKGFTMAGKALAGGMESMVVVCCSLPGVSHPEYEKHPTVSGVMYDPACCEMLPCVSRTLLGKPCYQTATARG